MLQYTNSLFWKTENPFLSISTDNMIERINNDLPTYEVTGSSDSICNLYFDIDYHITDNSFDNETNIYIKDTGTKYIQECIKQKFNKEAFIAIATSSYDKKYSWRYYVPSLKMKKNELKYFIIEMNKYVETNSDIYDVIEKQGTLFDENIYDNNRKIRCINTSKPNENRPLLLVQGSIKDTLITDTSNAELITLDIPLKITLPKSPTSVIDSTDLNKYQELLNIIEINPKDRKTWLMVCKCIIYNKMSNDDWLQFCHNNNLNLDEEKQQLFFNLQKKEVYPVEIYYLQSLAKKSNSVEYKKWLDKWNVYYMPATDLGDCYKECHIISKTLKNFVKYCNEDWYVLDDDNLWKKVKEPSYYIIREFRKYIDETIKKIAIDITEMDDEEDQKHLRKLILKYNSALTNCRSSYICDIKKYLNTLLLDNEFTKKLDSNKYIIAFKNGILDLTDLSFKNHIEPYDYISKTIPHDWIEPNKTDIDFVKTTLKKITNWNDTHLEYYLSILGYAMTGDSDKEQNFWFFRGETAENGKSVIFEVLEKIMPNYVEKSNKEFLDKGYDLKKEVPTWAGKRIIWVNELSTKPKDEDVVKAICDGTDYKYNRNYAIEAQKVSIGFKLFAVSNNTLNIKADNGIIRRFKLCQFGSQFKIDNTIDDFENLQFIRDKDLSNKLVTQYKNALLYLIFQYSKLYYDEKCLKPYPIEWKKDADEVMEENNEFQTWFLDTFELGKNLKISREQLELNLSVQFKDRKIKDELKRMKIYFEYKSQERYNSAKRGTYYGFELKKEIVIE